MFFIKKSRPSKHVILNRGNIDPLLKDHVTQLDGHWSTMETFICKPTLELFPATGPPSGPKPRSPQPPYLPQPVHQYRLPLHLLGTSNQI
ncbi:hypothetical protein DPMN_125917 [Dreissena polymorpha]|uniref:Uncharacterized protein n=1 Tax=Dreissena polymorpha TaxID=45954 RepID=A0A9D4JV50_DREPO|nr:hypothetical protein DPMN_125917 [Dreissena polymorpha]